MDLVGNLVVGQSGGPTSVINSSLYGIIDEALKNNLITGIIGMRHGLEGLLKEEFIDISRQSKNVLEAVRMTPGAALGGCRFKLRNEDVEDEINIKIFKIFKKYNIRFLVYIGGNDSMDTASKIHKMSQKIGYDLKVIGVPKTIDNDMVGTHHCPGFGSCVKYIATTVMEAGLHTESMYTSETVTILTTVGRNTGWLPAASAIAKRSSDDAPHLIYLPEVAFDSKNFIEDVRKKINEIGGVFIVTGEGLVDKDGKYIQVNSSSVATDAFGHPELGGVGEYLKGMVESELGVRARVITPAIAQQAAMHWASDVDLEEAEMVGRAAVNAIVEGKSGFMTTYVVNEQAKEYGCTTGLVELDKVANAERKVPIEFINGEGNFINQKFMDYVKPLIQGELRVNMEDGLPVYGRFERIPVEVK